VRRSAGLIRMLWYLCKGQLGRREGGKSKLRGPLKAKVGSLLRVCGGSDIAWCLNGCLNGCLERWHEERRERCHEGCIEGNVEGDLNGILRSFVKGD
jgi:hypothetical protein